jgi:hypothetical protein
MLLKERERRGWVDVKGISLMLEEPYWLVIARVRAGQFPAPTQTLPQGVRKYYSKEEATALVAAYKEGE